MNMSREELAFELRKGVQPERTSLAWSRTFLVLAAVFGLIGVHGYVTGVPIAIAAVAMAGAAAALLAGSWVAHTRLRSIHRVIEERLAVAAAVPTFLVTAASVVVSLIALLAIASPSW